MLTKAIIENFQSHKKTELEFVPGVNVLIGPSDAGKSALFRAIYWPISNRPLGDSFRSEWGGDTKVKLHFSEGNTVERFRSASKNSYILNGEELEAFGTNVPEEVEKAIGMDGCNIQRQSDQPFLLYNTPGEAARMLNRAASIDDIDVARDGIAKSLNRINAGMKYDEKQLKENSQKMEQYADLPEIEKRIENAEKLEVQRAKISGRTASLKRVVSRAGQVEYELGKSEYVSAALEKTASVEKAINTYQTEKAKSQQLIRLVKRAKEIQKYLKQTEGTEKALQRVEKLGKKLTQSVEARWQRMALKRLASQGRSITETINSLNREIQKLEKEYDAIAPETCPLCGSKMR
jgi:exonuclease SbcC